MASACLFLGVVFCAVPKGAVSESESFSSPPPKYYGKLGVALSDKQFEITETKSGVQVVPANAAELRNPWLVDIAFQSSAPAIHGEIKVKKMGARTVNYAESIEPQDGSGGELHILKAWGVCGNGFVLVTQSGQAEYPIEPDFSPAWRIFAATNCRKH